MPYFEVVRPVNIYDLLYNPATDNHAAVGSFLIDLSTVYPLPPGLSNETQNKVCEELSKWRDELMDYTPEYLFGYSLEGLDTIDQSHIDNVSDHVEIIYDYKLMKNVYFGIEDDVEFARVYEQEVDMNVDDLKTYPYLFVEKLKENPVMNDREYLKRKMTERLIYLIHDLVNAGSSSELYSRSQIGTMYDWMLTDVEIEAILDLHFRIMKIDSDDHLNIISLIKLEDLTR